MGKTTVVNIYNFIRRAHEEPGRFMQDDFDTIKRQMELLKQLGLPSTYALKHDALIEPAYQELMREYADETDEIAAWWEITGELCRRAGVSFVGERGEEYDDRVGTAYCLGYTPEERRRLLDAYMADFKEIFGYYPKTIGSWVIDIETFAYASEKYGVRGGALCRDQRGTDGFTLWGGYVNGAYYPSRKNEMIPAQTLENQLSMPVFRLLGPDPVYTFEEGFQEGVTGVYSLEPSCVAGRDPEWVRWMFDRLTKEDTIGMSYAQVGQENNFLWENIEPGFELQLRMLKKMAQEGSVRIETMAETAEWFTKKYRLTPPATFQASVDWRENSDLKAFWYSCRNYRAGMLWEKGKLFFRDWFLYDENYPSRYLEKPLTEKGSIFDALPLMDAHSWKTGQHRPKAEILALDGTPLCGEVTAMGQGAVNGAGEATSAKILWQTQNGQVRLLFEEDRIVLEGEVCVRFTDLPVLKRHDEKRLWMEHEGFSYGICAEAGTIGETDGSICLFAKQGRLELILEQRRVKNPSEREEESCFCPAYLENPSETDGYIPRYAAMQKTAGEDACTKCKNRLFPAAMPKFPGGDRVLKKGETAECRIEAEGEIFYTLDGTEPDKKSLRYEKPLVLSEDTEIRAKAFCDGFLESRTAVCRIFFGIEAEAIESANAFDPRRVFNRNGAYDLLDGRRGSLDYQDGRWLGTQHDLDVTLTLDRAQEIESVRIGFLSHHRSGILYPGKVCVWAGTDRDGMELVSEETLDIRTKEHEIERRDVCLKVGREARFIRIVAENVNIQPDWACYHGTKGAFMMADQVIIE